MSTLGEIAQINKKLARSKSIGLITGNFDILHVGHIELFEFAKSHVDILIIGVDSDSLANRYRNDEHFLINSLQNRMAIIKHLELVDFTFAIETNKRFNTLDKIHNQILLKLMPTTVFTNPLADTFYSERKDRCKKLDIPLVAHHNTKLLERLSVKAKGLV